MIYVLLSILTWQIKESEMHYKRRLSYTRTNTYSYKHTLTHTPILNVWAPLKTGLEYHRINKVITNISILMDISSPTTYWRIINHKYEHPCKVLNLNRAWTISTGRKLSLPRKLRNLISSMYVLCLPVYTTFLLMRCALTFFFTTKFSLDMRVPIVSCK